MIGKQVGLIWIQFLAWRWMKFARKVLGRQTKPNILVAFGLESFYQLRLGRGLGRTIQNNRMRHVQA